jgi:uncharacterized membrane protein
MVGSGVAHFANPGYFRGLVPPWVPAPAVVVALSGAADVAAGVLVALPATRRLGSWGTAALITAYLPAHVDPLRRAESAEGSAGRRARLLVPIAVNLGYIAWAVAVARRAG